MFIASGIVKKIFKEDITTLDSKVFPKITCIIERFDAHKKLLAIDFWGFRAYDYFIDIKEGNAVIVNFNVNSKEYSGKYYTVLNGIGIERYLGMSMVQKEKIYKKREDKELDKIKKEFIKGQIGGEDISGKGVSSVGISEEVVSIDDNVKKAIDEELKDIVNTFDEEPNF